MNISKNARQSNFELLRIISMLMIILHHYALHGNLISMDTSMINKAIGIFCVLWGKVGVNIFILISGYFLINTKISLKKIARLISEVYFYSILIMLINLFINNNVSIYMIKTSLFPIKLYWFFSSYIIMYCLIPLINPIIKKFFRKNYIGIIILLLLYMCRYLNIKWIWFVYVYSIGAFLRLHNIKFSFRIDKFCSLIFLGSLILILFDVNFSISKVISNESIKNYLVISQSYLPIFLISIIIFIFFNSMNIKNNKLINMLAESSFSVYLIHDNEFFRDYLWKNILLAENFYYAKPIFLILHIMFCVMIIYFFSFMINSFRLKTLRKNYKQK